MSRLRDAPKYADKSLVRISPKTAENKTATKMNAAAEKMFERLNTSKIITP